VCVFVCCVYFLCKWPLAVCYPQWGALLLLTLVLMAGAASSWGGAIPQPFQSMFGTQQPRNQQFSQAVGQPFGQQLGQERFAQIMGAQQQQQQQQPSGGQQSMGGQATGLTSRSRQVPQGSTASVWISQQPPTVGAASSVSRPRVAEAQVQPLGLVRSLRILWAT
jgi:hypothetical protein